MPGSCFAHGPPTHAPLLSSPWRPTLPAHRHEDSRLGQQTQVSPCLVFNYRSGAQITPHHHPCLLPSNSTHVASSFSPWFLANVYSPNTWGQACLYCHSPWPAPGGGHPGKRQSSLRHRAVPPGRAAGGLLGSEQKGICVTQTVISSLHDSLVYNVRATLGKAASVLRTMPRTAALETGG